MVETETWHSGKVENSMTFFDSFCACSLVSIALIRHQNIDLPEARRGAPVADGVDLSRFALGVTCCSVLAPVSGSSGTVASLPEIRSPCLISDTRKHAALLAAFDLPEGIAAELEVIALLIDRVTAAPIDQN